MTTWLAAGGVLSREQVMILLLSLAMLLWLARGLGELARQLRQPTILGELMAGVLLGPTVLGYFYPESYAWLFPAEGPVRIALEAMFDIAVVLLLLVAGMEVELSTVWRQGRSVVAMSVTSILIPFLFGFALAWWAPQFVGMPGNGGHRDPLPFALFIGVALSITALPVVAKILIDLKLARTGFGSMVLSTAVLNDFLGWLGFALILAMIEPEAASMATGAVVEGVSTAVEVVRSVGRSPDEGEGLKLPALPVTIGLTIAYAAIVLTVGRFLFDRSMKFFQTYIRGTEGVLGFIIVIAFVGAAFTQYIGMHSVFGAFMIGVAIGNSRNLRPQTRETIYQFITHFFAPLFLASIGLRVNFIANFSLVPVLAVLVIAMAGKILGAYAGAVWTGITSRKALALGFGMSARGAMEIILGKLALQYGLITESVFVPIVIMALVTSLISGPAIQKLMRPRRKRPRRLADYLTPEQFIPALKACDMREAIRELSGRAGQLTGLDAAQIDHAVWTREQIVRTGIQGGLAIPHARLDEVTKPVIVFGRSEKGVDFQAPDGQLARLICLILLPTREPDLHIQMLSLIAKTFAHDQTRERAIQAGDFNELIDALRLAPMDAVSPAPAAPAAPAVA